MAIQFQGVASQLWISELVPSAHILRHQCLASDKTVTAAVLEWAARAHPLLSNATH